MEEIDPLALARALSEIPLFRELQRLLAAQTGPVNWEIAGQIARAVAGAGSVGTHPTEDVVEEFRQACRVAELRLTEQTGFPATAELTDVGVIGRKEWAEINLASFRPLVDRLALKFKGGQEVGGPIPIQGFLEALGPLLLGVQVGFMSGYLSRKVLGQYELCFPTNEAGKLWFVYPNITELERELDLDPQQFRMWLSLHEVAHQIEFESIEWTRPYFLSLIERYIDSAELDAEEILTKLRSLGEPESLSQILEHPEQLLPMLVGPAQQQTLDEIQAFMSVCEGYADWAMEQTGREMLTQFDKMREGMSRRRAERSSAERLLERLLGLDLKAEQYRAGGKFISTAAKAGRLEVLWSNPSYLPNLEEVNTPAEWLDRVGYF